MAMFDVPVAFLQTLARDDKIIKLQGAIVKIMLKITPHGRNLSY